MKFKYIIVGSGFSGSVLAERIANQLNEKVLLIEKRNHIGGNCYDYYNDDGILIHKYGPHIFHTNYKEVWDYLSSFTEWHAYEHRVLAMIDNKKVPVPFNLNSLHMLFKNNIASRFENSLIEAYGINIKVPILKLRESNNSDLKVLADFIYENVFLNYNFKQWGMRPEELDSSVTGRVPVFVSRDNRYFQDQYQGIPKDNYAKIFEKMLAHKNIKFLLNTDYKEVIN